MQSTCFAYLLHSITVSYYFIKAVALDYTKQLHSPVLYMPFDTSGRDIVLCFDSQSLGPLLFPPTPHTHILCFTMVLDLMSLR